MEDSITKIITELEGKVLDLESQIANLDGEYIIGLINKSNGSRIDGEHIEVTRNTLIENDLIKKSHLE